MSEEISLRGPEKTSSTILTGIYKKSQYLATEARMLLKNNAQFVYRVTPEGLIPVFRQMFYELTSRINYGRGDMPLTVGIETIAACTRKCNYCPVSKNEFVESRPERVMSDHIFSRIIDDLASLRRKGGGVGFNGNLFLNGYGEPFLDRELPKRVKEAREKLPEAMIAIYSNGDRMDAEKVRKLIENGLDRIILTPHDGSFKKEIKDLAEEYPENIVLNPPLELLSTRGGSISGIPEQKQLKPIKKCVSATYALWVAADGTVSMCCNDALVEEKMGNINEKRIIDIWDDPLYVKIRQMLRNGDWENIPQLCKDCVFGKK